MMILLLLFTTVYSLSCKEGYNELESIHITKTSLLTKLYGKYLSSCANYRVIVPTIILTPTDPPTEFIYQINLDQLMPAIDPTPTICQPNPPVQVILDQSTDHYSVLIIMLIYALSIIIVYLLLYFIKRRPRFINPETGFYNCKQD